MKDNGIVIKKQLNKKKKKKSGNNEGTEASGENID